MGEQKNNSSSTFSLVRKYLPYVFLGLLTIALMFFFKYNKEVIGKFVEAGKNNLLSLYANNLKPLLVSTPITEEDVFNFALYQSLPLDKNKNKILVINSDESNNQVYEIRTASFNGSTNNYETFVKYLGLNKEQKEAADSILNSYKKEIYASVFVSDKNTFAVNPKISELQQAVLADLVSFSQKINPKKTQEIFQKSFTRNDDTKIASLISSAKQNAPNEFLLFTPDTVAATYAEWNQEKFYNQLAEMEKSKESALKKAQEFDFKLSTKPPVPPAVSETNKDFPMDFKFTVDSNMYKVVVPLDSKHLSHVIEDSLRVKLNEVAAKLKKMSIQLNKQKGKLVSNKIQIPSSKDLRHMNLEIVNPYEIINQTFEALSKANVKSWEEYGNKMDSLGKMYDKKWNDSIKKQIREQVRKYKYEVKRSSEKAKPDTNYTSQFKKGK